MVFAVLALSLDKGKHHLSGSHMEFSMCSALKKKCWLQLIYMLGTLMTANKTSQAHFFYVQVKPRHPREKFCVKLTPWSFCWHWKHANNVPQKTDA